MAIKSFHDLYDEWVKTCYGELTEVQRVEMKKAFFSGASQMFISFNQATVHPSEEVCVAQIENMRIELEAQMKAW